MAYIYNRISIYLIAHQDDSILFMEPQLSTDLVDVNCRTIVIHVTAGDAGIDDTYWQARETAAVDSVVFRLSENGAVQQSTGMQMLSGKSFRQDEINHMAMYFLRLPDGNKNGSGFSRQKHGSLEHLQNKTINQLHTVDHNAVYQSFDELVDLLHTVVEQELSGCRVNSDCLILNYPEYDKLISPNDHSDHYSTGQLGAALLQLGNGMQRIYTHYACLAHDKHLYGDALFWKTGMFAIYHQAVLKECGYSTLGEKSHYQQWCSRESIYRCG